MRQIYLKNVTLSYMTPIRKTAAELDSEAKIILQNIHAAGDSLKMKDKLALPPQPMPELELAVRTHSLDEVAIGYTEAQAIAEASRCLNCKNPTCVSNCPVHMHIPEFIAEIAKGNFKAAFEKITEDSLLPAVCGRVCPQERQCQKACTVGKCRKDQHECVSIGRLERFVADYTRTHNLSGTPSVKPDTGKRVAVIGSGPAGLAVAADVRREGHAVTVFEAYHELGGIMRYGIPEFRLPKKIIDHETETLSAMGVEFKMNFTLGETRTLAQLLNEDKFDAVFIGTGANEPLLMNIEGENFAGVFTAKEYLMRANALREKDASACADWAGKDVAVLGGGNVAMDASRMALRLGAKHVRIIYRRTEKEMPACCSEIHEAREEGIEICELQCPSKILSDAGGRVRGLLIDKYKLGEPDEKGRPRPVKLEGQSFETECDTVLLAIGSRADGLPEKDAPELKTDAKGNIRIADPATNGTFMEHVFAGGDAVLGPATVILAMGEGRRAVAGINALLSKK